MARANHSTAFAGPSRAVRGAVEQYVFDVSDVVRRTYAALLRRGSVRRALHDRAGGRDHQLDKAHSRAYAHASALAVLMDQMERLYRSGATLEELLRVPETLTEHAHTLSGTVPRSLDVLDSEEARIDANEDVLQMRRRIHGETPAGNREEADLAARIATHSAERALTLRTRATQLEALGVLA